MIRFTTLTLLTVLAAPAPAQEVGQPLDAGLMGAIDRPVFPDGEPPAELQAILATREAATLDDLADPRSDFYRRRAIFRVPGARAQVIEAAARGVGIRGGYAFEAERINKLLLGPYRGALDTSFPFDPLMLQAGFVVPPVISQVDDVRELSGPDFLYLSVGAYEIVRQPRLTTKTPSWMDYLLLPIRAVRPPRAVLLENGAEEAVWRAAVEDAWATGVREARMTFTTKLATLSRDYQGMRLYHFLAAEGALQLPRIDVERVPYRVTPDGQRAFEDETTIEIVVGPEFRRR